MANTKFIERYRNLIALPTISSLEAAEDQSNKQLIELLATWLADFGFKTEIIRVEGSRDKYNLLATYGEGEGGLLLAGHTDTVPFDEGKWTFNPFALTEQDGKFYGLGTADMKGFFAFIVDVVSQIDLNKLTKPLRILATADEETTMLGARTFAQHTHIRPDCAIIGEPTSLKPIRAHKGHVGEAVRITGKSGHSSNPDRGINAIELMHQATGYLMNMRNQLREKYHNDLFKVPYPTMNFGNIHGGDAINRICACCELQFDMRPLPNLPVEDLYAMVNENLKPMLEQYSDLIEIRHLHDGIPGYECEHSAQVVQVVEKLLGEKCDAVNYCTEAPFIQQLCPTLVLGPGSIEQAHQPDEFLETKFIEPTRELLTKMILHFCA
ncbi:acetylornithine deacetylase [Actinobacillus pleuropneumoniae]|uniref:Acetylornithine deacetylase n=1 Tax=Actinobacillus pleuropneumoniae serovar 6 str. Femo TaxID=754256 RepID=A0A828PIE9_ACTPL|nr:acetylornithine deacetylase [Actinobacillus pleuropneumoniae]EFL81384.1 acetylornithine deacetylase [Actinobacillus pleuropneumoniae serovar 6 str. Femo]EFM91775.1 Acetylornithine deacetylase [Actinobacillus pleuropneumoniae serovar 6 str. Femo]UKH11532.1 acetylornithine deacetylase [Actinobacillus pleuropneumoniae serovar 6 str. Femo]SUU65148.1 acetylornithine deacetylase [Actinobacillus pleuropneumoniae]